MSDDWLEQLNQIRKADEAKHQVDVEDLDLALLKKREAVSNLLRKSKAHELLRQIQKTLLGGQGTLDVFDRAKDYDRGITLVWQGPISSARRVDPEDSEPCSYILVGVRDEKLWVNGKRVSGTSSDALKAALLQACRKPGRVP